MELLTKAQIKRYKIWKKNVENEEIDLIDENDYELFERIYTSQLFTDNNKIHDDDDNNEYNNHGRLGVWLILILLFAFGVDYIGNLNTINSYLTEKSMNHTLSHEIKPIIEKKRKRKYKFHDFACNVYQ